MISFNHLKLEVIKMWELSFDAESISKILVAHPARSCTV
jgi:hypothetical protein